MRVWLTSVLVVLVLMSVFAQRVVRPVESSSREVIESYYTAGDSAEFEQVAAIMARFRERADEAGLPPVDRAADLLLLSSEGEEGATRAAYDAAFAEAYREVTGVDVTDTPRLIWSTGPNPARRIQMALFRAWHLRTFGEPIDIAADPSNRDLTKSIVQSVAGAGPDLIEYIGAAHLRNLVRAGIAHDLTDYANEHGFATDSVFPAAVTSIAFEDADGELRQYGYPCNLDYKVLLYHRDLFEQAGVPEPVGGWTFDEMREIGGRVLAADGLVARPQFVVMNLGALNTALSAGGRLFTEPGQALCEFDSQESVAGLRAFQELMYEHGAMPRPADAASMSATTAGGFGGLAGVSAPGLFAQRSILLHVGGRWEYVVFAIANRDRVYVPAIDRALAALDPSSPEGAARAALLRGTRTLLLRDVLLALSDEQMAALRDCLSDEDRRRLLHIGAAHIPTTTGNPSYSVSARCTVVNRALEQGDPRRLELARRFIRFLGSEAYNEQVNGAFDSIAGRIEYALDDDGVSGPPAALPGLEGFDSPVFAEAVLDYGEPRQQSPYIGRNRLLTLMTEVLEDVQSDSITPEEAARRAEESVNRQILANLAHDARLKARWVEATGVDPARVKPGRKDSDGRVVTIRAQVEGLRARSGGGS